MVSPWSLARGVANGVANDVVGAGRVFGVPPDNKFSSLYGHIVVGAQPGRFVATFADRSLSSLPPGTSLWLGLKRTKKG